MDSSGTARGRIPGLSPPRVRRNALLSAFLLVPASGLAQDRPLPARPAPTRLAPKIATPARPGAPDPAFDATKAAFEALPEAERKAIQDALIWTGDFNAVVSGAFGRRTFDALTAYRSRAGGADPLDPRGRAALLAAGEAAKAAARFRVAPDPGSGAVIGVPERLLARRTALPAGTRWQSADGRVTLETRAFPPGGETLDTLFEQATAPLPNRKVTYTLRRPESLVVTAETGTGLSYIRYDAGPQGVRGFLIGYDRALAPEVGRLVIAVANAFAPFPAPAAPAPAAAPASGPSAAAAPPALWGTGLVVAPGRVLTASAVLEGCATLRIGPAPARVLATDPAGLALLEAPGAPAAIRPPVRTDPPAADEGLIALAQGPDGGLAAPAKAVPGGVVAPLQPGSAGAPVLDGSGRLVGLVARYPAAPRSVAGIVPPARLPLVPAQAVSDFLAGQGLAEAKPHRDGGPGAVVPALVGITCR
ncbi:serine protease [Methylobacterium sp. NEAU K]|uniref:S1 family peptidase n=1 Tax=Methylobacterium sp. NEAU K TaxID=3064946 RepID=UPI00273355F4|nr:serine protease [Methylobacterium sp. NEAU K]MDP4005767.1 serine protease [Methylobacterium sp. NEAU K]